MAAAFVPRPYPPGRLSTRLRLQRMFMRLAVLLVFVTGVLAAAGTTWLANEREADFVAEGGEDGEWSESSDDDARSTRQSDFTGPPCERDIAWRHDAPRASPRTRAPPPRRWILPRRVPPDDDGDAHA